MTKDDVTVGATPFIVLISLLFLRLEPRTVEMIVEVTVTGRRYLAFAQEQVRNHCAAHMALSGKFADRNDTVFESA